MTTDASASAEPTKAFFISMLIKDISLESAIKDLVDNSVDAARKARSEGDLKGLWVEIVANPQQFSITDNCGGIQLDDAKARVFRFGRDNANVDELVHSIGQFGVGMKRAIFKVGTEFRVSSVTDTTRFDVNVDVLDWEKETGWTFPITGIEEPEADVTRGTSVVVGRLRTEVASQFARDQFLNRLATEIESAHQNALESGLRIRLNTRRLNAKPPTLLTSHEIQPIHKTFEWAGRGGGAVQGQLYAGVAKGGDTPDSKHGEPGWYLFCNGRLILEADTSQTTGWGEEEAEGIPRFHNQYNAFRGYAFLDSDHVSDLPWNTTKDDVDRESPIYWALRREMIMATRPVVDFLNDLKREREQGGRKLNAAMRQARYVAVSGIAESKVFGRPAFEASNDPTTTITYSKPRGIVDRVKRALPANTNGEVGSKTFDFFLQYGDFEEEG